MVGFERVMITLNLLKLQEYIHLQYMLTNMYTIHTNIPYALFNK